MILCLKLYLSKKIAFIELVSAILGIDNLKEENIKFLNQEQINKYGKKGIEFDIVAKVKICDLKKKILINVEMQNIVNKTLAKRSATYASFLNVISLDKGEDYNAADVECMWLLLSDEQELFIDQYNVVDSYVFTRKSGKTLAGSPKIHFVNLKKLNISGSIFLQEI